LPAHTVVPEGTRHRDVSRVSKAKRDAAEGWRERLERILQGSGLALPANIDQLEKEYSDLDWLAVVHADGNGLGQIFLNFDGYVTQDGDRAARNAAYISEQREFSAAIETATEAAFLTALKELPSRPPTGRKRRTVLPIVPLVLGGDDLTVVCDGSAALLFTRRYLMAFEEETAKSPIIKRIATAALGCGRLSACAGVAITKPHFPFYSAYALAEELLRSAKAVKKNVVHQTSEHKGKSYPCSAMDFHVLYDSTFSALKSIRDRLVLREEKTSLTAKPYVVTPRAMLNGAALGWAERHDAELLDRLIAKMRAPGNDGRRKFPSSQLHDLREALFLGHTVANARLQLIRQRYDLDELLEGCADGGSLFRKDATATGQRDTLLLDALDSEAFWGVREKNTKP